MQRPYKVHREVREICKEKFPTWLRERNGIVVYQNHVLDSSHCGETTFMPAKFYAEGVDGLQDAPEEHRPNGGLPSLRQQKIDHVRLEEFGGDVDKCLSVCFVFEE